MGFDGIYSIYHRNEKTQEYEKLAFYDKDGKELYAPFPTRDSMLNQLLLGYNRHGFDFESIDVRRGLPEWYIIQLKTEHPDWFEDDVYTYNVDEGTYYDYLELKGWAAGNACDFKDWFAAEEDETGQGIEIPVRNPLKSFINFIDIYLKAYNIYYPKPGEVIIVCEMSY